MDSSRRAILDSLVPRAIVPMPSAGIQLKLSKSHSGTIAFVIIPKRDETVGSWSFAFWPPQKRTLLNWWGVEVSKWLVHWVKWQSFFPARVDIWDVQETSTKWKHSASYGQQLDTCTNWACKIIIPIGICIIYSHVYVYDIWYEPSR